MIRVALIGFGLSGRAFHAPFLTTTPGLELAHVVTRDPARAAAAEALGAAVHDAASDVLSPAVTDLVVVATPNRTHVELALAAVAAGLPVVVDKPVAVDVAGVRELMAAGGLVIPFHNRRWDGDLLTLRRLLEAGALGEVARFESRFERWRPAVAAGWRESSEPDTGGGVLLDLGPHLVDQALTLFGPVDDVRIEADVRRPGAQVPDDAFIALRHRSGVRSHLWMSAVAADLGPRLRVLGSEGAFVRHGMDPQEAVLRAGGGPHQEGYGEDPAGALLHRGPGDCEPVPLERGDYGAFYRGVTATLHDGAPPPVTLADALAVAEILEVGAGRGRQP